MSGRVLVSGATGFTGSETVRALVGRGADVGIIKRPSSSLEFIDDLRPNLKMFDYAQSLDSLRPAMDFRPDMVVHMAARFTARHQPADIEGLIGSNILFGTHLLEAMKQAGVGKLLNISTAWQNVGGCYRPYSLYTATKQCMEDIIQFYCLDCGLSAVSLRLSDSYAANDPRPKIVNLLRRISQTGETIKMSPGEQELDLLYMDDVVAGVLQAMEELDRQPEALHRTYALTSGAPVQLRKLAELMREASGKPLHIEWGALEYRKNEIMKVAVPDNVLPGWRPRISLEEGFKKCFA